MKTWYGENCKKCSGLNEPYMVNTNLWKRVTQNTEGFICISCFEILLGRNLKIKDFIAAPINNGYFGFDAKTYIKYGKKYLDYCHKIIKKGK